MKFLICGVVGAGILLGASGEAQAQAMGPACSKLYGVYSGKRGPKAFALSANGRTCQWATSGRLDAAQNNAVRFCQQRARQACRIMASQF